MDEWIALADASGRNVPYLWLGPTAAGHLKPPGRILSEGNNAVWHYALETAKEARARQVDVLGMYNLTLQANSWDGSYYGLRVGLVQAMMVRSSSYDDDDIEMEAALTRLGYQLAVEGRVDIMVLVRIKARYSLARRF